MVCGTWTGLCLVRDRTGYSVQGMSYLDRVVSGE
jgi:hypothetical protein